MKINIKVLLLLLSVYMPLVGHASAIIYEIAILIMYYMLQDKGNLPRELKYFLVPIFIAAGVGFQRGYDLYSLFKDVYYVLIPVISIMLGRLIAIKWGMNIIMRVISKAALIVSLIVILINFFHFGLDVLINPRPFRDNDPSFTSMPGFIIIAILYKAYEYTLGNKQSRDSILQILFLLFAVYQSGSRSFILSVILSFGILLYFLYKNRSIYFRKSMYIIAGVAAIFSIYSTQLSDNELINISAEELKTGDYSTPEEINTYYRGYEAFMAMNQIMKEPFFYKLFGCGLGATVYIPNCPVGVDDLPMLHNGYPYILLKFGWFGAFMILLFFVHVFRTLTKRYSLSRENIIFFFFITTGCLIIIMLQSTVNALFNYEYIFPFVIVSASLTSLYKNHRINI